MGLTDPYSGRLGSESSGSGSGMQTTLNEAIIWEDRVRSLKDIVTNGKYPCVVKVNLDNVAKYMQRSGIEIPADRQGESLAVDVLELRRHKMVATTKLQWERRTGEYSKTDKHYDINVAQKGIYMTVKDIDFHLKPCCSFHAFSQNHV